MNRLTAQNVTYRVAGRNLLEKVDLTVEPGEILAVVGPNGAGKSTLLGVLAGDLHPNEGTVDLDGTPLSDFRLLELARRRAVLPQSGTVQFAFTVTEIVHLGRSAATESSADPAIVAAALEASDMTAYAARSYLTLSGGERARADLARVLAQDTPILLLDEPTSALDLRHQHTILDVARTLALQGRAVLTVLHDLNLAAAYAHRIAVLVGGRVAGIGTPEEVINTDLITEVFAHPVTIIPHPDTGRPVVIS